MMLMHELKKIVENCMTILRPEHQERDIADIPLIICCDLNSLPNSGVIEYLSSGKVAADHSDFKELRYQDCLKKLSSTEGKNEFTHPFKIARAYNDDAMPFTNYT
jgi:CCR4-NOT transcription complex subunit 6